MGKTKTQEEFVAEVYKLTGQDYTVIGEYTKAHNKIKMKHNCCGYEYDVRPSAFKYGARCPMCAGNLKKDDSTFKKEVFEQVGFEYEPVNEYKSFHEKVEMRHSICGATYKVTPGHFLVTGRRCPYCMGGVLLKNYDFSNEVYNLTNGEYIVLGAYENTKTHVLMKHTVCGNTWNIRPDNFKSGKRCPSCNQSHGELEIERLLKKNHLQYELQFKFTECRKVRPLPFDFAIKSNGNVIALIEYNGEQHYKEVAYFGGAKGFVQRTENDKIKRDFCRKHKIPLYVIRFDENIESEINTMITLSQAPEKSWEGATTR